MSDANIDNYGQVVTDLSNTIGPCFSTSVLPLIITFMMLACGYAVFRNFTK